MIAIRAAQATAPACLVCGTSPCYCERYRAFLKRHGVPTLDEYAAMWAEYERESAACVVYHARGYRLTTCPHCGPAERLERRLGA